MSDVATLFDHLTYRIECPLCPWGSMTWTAEDEVTSRRTAGFQWHVHVREAHAVTPRVVEVTGA